MKRQSGFSLVELLIATMVLVVLMGAVVSQTRMSQLLHSQTQQGLDLQQNVRSALSIICRELVNTGSGIPYITSLNGSPPILVPASARLGPLGAALGTTQARFVTVANNSGQSVTRDGEGGTLGTAITTDMLVVLGGTGDGRFVNLSAPGPTGGWGATVYVEDSSVFSIGQLVLVSNGFDLALGQITSVVASNGLQFTQGQDDLGLNASASEATPSQMYYAAQQVPGGPPPQVMPLSSITYYIDSATNPAHPMLRRLSNSSGGAAAGTVVADNIENLQVRFLVDSDANATTPSVEIDAPTSGQVGLIRGATVSLTGRSQLRTEDRNNTDRHSRLTLSQTVFFRNNIRR